MNNLVYLIYIWVINTLICSTTNLNIFTSASTRDSIAFNTLG